MNKKMGIKKRVEFGKARKLIRDAGKAIEANDVVYTFAEWQAIDAAIIELEAENRRYRELMLDQQWTPQEIDDALKESE